MRNIQWLQVLLLSMALMSLAVEAGKQSPHSDNFRMVIDHSTVPNQKRNRNGRQQNSFLAPSMEHQLTDKRKRNSCQRDYRKIFENIQFREIYERTRRKCGHIKDRMCDEAVMAWQKAQKLGAQYTSAEIGLYTSLACALTFALQAIFAKTPCKTLDVGIITYLLNMASRQTFMPKELIKPKRSFKIYTTSSVFSSDGKTYIRLLKKGASKKRAYPPAPPAPQESYVRIEPVQTFYRETEEDVLADEGVPPASHNAVLSNMTPYMRQKLKARRMRGGGFDSGIMERLTIGFYFGAWYALNIVYNIVNKKVLNVLPAPLTVGSFQFGVGALYCALVWLVKLRPTPQLTSSGKQSVFSVGVYHALGQLASMISLGAGPVSFTHIVKAMEPFFSAVVSGLYSKKWMKLQVYLTLIPVVCGVGYACMKELNFSWLAFGAAMSSNLFFALRAVMSKRALQSGGSTGTNLTPPNMFGLVTWAAFLLSIPMALIGEGKGFMGLWDTALATVESKKQFYKSLVMSGLVHYLNNEVMYLALGKVHPVTLAVGNTMKRVFILVASVMVFRNQITVQAGIGSGIGIGGVLLYSLTKQYYENLEIAEAAKEKEHKGKWRFARRA